jgi:hypothetical protein
VGHRAGLCICRREKYYFPVENRNPGGPACTGCAVCRYNAKANVIALFDIKRKTVSRLTEVRRPVCFVTNECEVRSV